MIAVLTGDIINSRQIQTDIWLTAVKAALNKHGQEPAQWEVYRGDSFQLEIAAAGKALHIAIYLKACIKELESLDVRVAIGLGDKSYTAEKVTESNGTAFINSGEAFESLKKQTLGIQCPDKAFEEEMNLYFDFASLHMDNWSSSTAKIIKTALEHPSKNQVQLAKLIGTTQSNISETYARGGFYPIMKLIKRFEAQVQ